AAGGPSVAGGGSGAASRGGEIGEGAKVRVGWGGVVHDDDDVPPAPPSRLVKTVFAVFLWMRVGHVECAWSVVAVAVASPGRRVAGRALSRCGRCFSVVTCVNAARIDS